MIRLRDRQLLTGTGMLATMRPGAAFAIAGQLAHPGRQVVTVVGDGGFAMLMAELSTAVANNLPIKIILFKNNSLGEVKFEQKELGNPEGCELASNDIVAFAKACGAALFGANVPMKSGPRSPPRCARRSLHSSRRWLMPTRGLPSRMN